MVQRLIVDSVVYWAKAYHLDGFRFDIMVGSSWSKLFGSLGVHCETVHSQRVVVSSRCPLSLSPLAALCCFTFGGPGLAAGFGGSPPSPRHLSLPQGHLLRETVVDCLTQLRALTREKDGVDGPAMYLYGEGW